MILSKYNLLKAINPLCKAAISWLTVDLVNKKCHDHKIKYLDLGGMAACEGYLVIHISPVELYGLPYVPKYTQELYANVEERPKLRRRDLTAPSVILNYDLSHGIPVKDTRLKGINISHMLEHMPLEFGRKLLRESFRVLEPGGIVRVSCPDLKKYAKAYILNDFNFWDRVGKLPFCNYSNLPTPGAIFAGKAYDNKNDHQWFYDADTVVALMLEAGFASAAETSLHESSLPRIQEIEPRFREPESFYVEATK